MSSQRNVNSSSGTINSADRSEEFARKGGNLKGCKKFIWSDIQCLLEWVRNTEDVHPKFVENRLEEIPEYHGEVCYVPSKENRADLATKVCSPKELFTNE